jgi:hypothetical protein
MNQFFNYRVNILNTYRRATVVQYFIASCWDAVMINRHNPLRYLSLSSQHYFMQVLGWMWSTVFSLTFLSIFYFGLTWMAHVLLFGGVAMTVAVFRESERQAAMKAAVTIELSTASRCVWKLDSEA